MLQIIYDWCRVYVGYIYFQIFVVLITLDFEIWSSYLIIDSQKFKHSFLYHDVTVVSTN